MEVFNFCQLISKLSVRCLEMTPFSVTEYYSWLTHVHRAQPHLVSLVEVKVGGLVQELHDAAHIAFLRCTQQRRHHKILLLLFLLNHTAGKHGMKVIRS